MSNKLKTPKEGSKFISRQNRQIVTIVGAYNSLGRIVVNYNHYRAKDQVGALFLADFYKYYRPKPVKNN